MPRTPIAVTVVCLACISAAKGFAGGLSPQQLLDQMSARFDTVNDYDIVVNGTSWENGKEESQRYRFAFKKPHLIRLRTVAGANKGGELCVRSDGKIRARKSSGLLKVIAITMNRDDRRLKDSEGIGVWEMDYGSLIGRLQRKVQAPGNQCQVAAPERPEGEYELSLRYGPGKMAGVVDRYWIDSQTMWILRFERSRNDTPLERMHYSELRINPGLADGYFNF